MLKLDKQIKLTKAFIESPNIADQFDRDDLRRIGDHAHQGYTRDRASRAQWEKRMEAAMDLAMQISKDKNFPWPNCSNIAFPLVTIATLQFQARAYSSIIQGNDVVKCRVVGSDPDGSKQERANRISRHMSYQVLEEDQAWEEQHDRLLINIPIVGCAFKKSYNAPSKGHNISELVLAKDLVLDYYAKSVEACARKTHIVPLYRNEIYERVMTDVFNDVLGEGWYKSPQAPRADTSTINSDIRKGMVPPQPDQDTPFVTLEQHCSLDLDGDGYAEPYIVTIEEQSRTVLRIACRFERESDVVKNTHGEIIQIRPTEYFTKYSFIPAPDGGIYDIGFGVLLGPLNESVNSLVNQLVDAGTMSNSAGGFLGRGAKIRGGVYTFAPLEWKRVDSTGDDLRKSIFPLPVREPSAVLFNLLALLVQYTNRVAGTTEVMVGENLGQNTPAETTRTLREEGTKIYNTIFKRIWRGMKEEFKKLYILNAVYLEQKKYFGTGQTFVLREDYLGDPNSVVPVADPNLTSDQARFMQASALKQSAAATPGYDIAEVERRYLRTLKVEEIDQVYPGPDKVPQGKDVKLMIQEMKLQGRQAELQQEMLQFALQLEEDRRLNTAKIAKLEAEAIKLMGDLKGDQADRRINAINAAIGAIKAHNDTLKMRAETVMKQLEAFNTERER